MVSTGEARVAAPRPPVAWADLPVRTTEGAPPWRASTPSAPARSSTRAATPPSRSRSRSTTAPSPGPPCPAARAPAQFEAVELRDGDKKRYGGKGVEKAVIARPRRDRPRAGRLRGQRAAPRRPGAASTSTARRTRRELGANAILGVSLAVARAAAESAELPLFRYVGGPNAHLLPVPMMNILNGGAHADTGVDIQEFMIAPIGAPTFREALQLGRRGLPRAQGGAEGARPRHRARRRGRLRARPAQQPRRARPHRRRGRARPASRLGDDIALALDVAATEFYDDGGLRVRGRQEVRRRDDRLLRRAGGGLPAGLHRGPAERGRLGRLAGADRPARRPRADRRRRPVRHQPGAAAARHRRGRGQRAARQGQPDRHPDRDARRRRAWLTATASAA